MGRPRAHDSTNSGIGGVASTDVEPTKITIYNIFDSTCICQKPIEVREISRRASTDYTRVTTFEYFTDSKLVKTRSVTNPATVGTLPLPGTVSWQYTYVRAMTTSQAWGAWLPATEVTPDGTYSYTYSSWLDRSDQLRHGQIAGTVVRSIDDVRIQTSLTSGTTSTTTTVAETLHRNLSNSPGGYSKTGFVSGQPRAVVDGDGIISTWDYSSEGWLNVSYEHGGVEKTVFTRGVSGNVETMITNAGSTGSGGLAATIDYPDQSGDGLVYTASTSSGGLQRTSKFFHDRFGHLAVVQKNNLDSAGNQPSKHTGSGSSARAWVETQSHFLHHWLMEQYADRKPRDEGAGTGQFLKTQYVYLSNGRLDYVVQPNGSRTDFDIDGFGALYRSVTQDPSATLSVTPRKLFINPFLEVTGSYESTGSDHLWTTVTRNSAGAITQIVEPSTTAPLGYSGATGGAIHQFEIDQMGRVVEARAYAGTPGTTTLATRREVHFDQLDRQIWQHDVVLGFGSGGDHYIAWQYASAKASQLGAVKRTGVEDQTYGYNNLTSPVTGFLMSINDGFSGGGNTVTYAYHANTPFVSGITRVDLDPASSTPRTTTATYGVDPFGHVIALHEGSGTTLDHAYAYDSLGRVDRYTDPLGRVQKFLTDGAGRVVEHVWVGDGSDYIVNSVGFDDSGASDGRTKVSRYDGLGNVTINHADFAGRPFIVQNPGGDTVPTSSAKNQSMCLYVEYDSASRITAVYDGDGGKTEFWRDGAGRMIQRQLTVAGGNHTRFNSKDVLLRDAIGRLYETNILGSTNSGSSPNHALAIVDEEFDVDSVGRIHEERYEFPYFAPVNELKVTSTFVGGNPYRSDLNYADSLAGSNAALSAPINLDFDHDSIGRLTSIEWNVSGGSGQQPLAEYTWVGGLRRNRTVHYGSDSANEMGVTAYAYDAYNRLLQIQDEVWTSSSHAIESQFDYVYDAAGNLLKEKYTKADTSVGDRFAYDAYHRLTAASMGVNSTTMNASSDPTGWSSGAMHEYLTYGLDEANNRTGTASWVSSTAQSTGYTLQDSGHAQGQSNRYDTVTLPGASPVTYEYDDRGNLRYDGRFLFQYDFLNRLQEVWKVTLVEGETGDAEKFAIIEQTALRDSKQEVKDSIPDLMSRLPREHKDPVFRNRLKARLHGGVIRLHPPQQGGGGMMLNPQLLITDADLELTAVYGYDAFNRRIMSIIVDPDWSDTAFHTYDGWRQVVQYTLDSTNSSYKAAPTKEFVWGSQLDELLSYRRRVGSAGSYSWENYFILHGGQDTAAKLVNPAGAIVEQYEYDPYGRVSIYDGNGSSIGAASAFGMPFLWKSIRLDDETGLLFMRNRYYSVVLGRFLTGDLLGVWGDPLNGGNQYAYCCNNSLVLADPMGLQAGTAGGSVPPSGNTLFTNDPRDAIALGTGDFNLRAPEVPPTTRSGAPAAAASQVGVIASLVGKVTCKQVSRDKCVKAQAAAGGPTTGPSWQGGSDCLTKENCPQCWECTASGDISLQAYHDRNRSWMKEKEGADVARVLNHERGHLLIAIMMANAYSDTYSYKVLSCSREEAYSAASQMASNRLRGIQSLAMWRNRRAQESYEDETANGTKAGPQAKWDADVRQ